MWRRRVGAHGLRRGVAINVGTSACFRGRDGLFWGSQSEAECFLTVVHCVGLFGSS